MASDDAKRRRTRRTSSAHCAGEEALRVATSAHLLPGDCISDTDYGLELSGWLANGSSTATPPAKQAKNRILIMPALPDRSDSLARLRFAPGFAVGLKWMSPGKVLLVYVAAEDARKPLWRELLPLIAAQELPVVFAILPPPEPKPREERGLHLGHGFGVASISVDCDDLIGIYRVAQESVARARAGGGPAIIACIPFRLQSQRKIGRGDALLSLEQTMRAMGLGLPVRKLAF